MSFFAKALYVRFSPFKLRPIIDVIRGKNVYAALSWLSTCQVKRVVPIKKLIESAAANAKSLDNIDPADLKIQEIKIDHGPTYDYFKPGAMGRANVQKKRSSHLQVRLIFTGKEV
jgi:large subunit ribosomal protein L22